MVLYFNKETVSMHNMKGTAVLGRLLLKYQCWFLIQASAAFILQASHGFNVLHWHDSQITIQLSLCHSTGFIYNARKKKLKEDFESTSELNRGRKKLTLDIYTEVDKMLGTKGCHIVRFKFKTIKIHRAEFKNTANQSEKICAKVVHLAKIYCSMLLSRAEFLWPPHACMDAWQCGGWHG